MLDNDGKYYCEEEGCGRELCGDMVGSDHAYEMAQESAMLDSFWKR